VPPHRGEDPGMSAAVPTAHRPGGDDGHAFVPPVVAAPLPGPRRPRRDRGWAAAVTSTALWLYAAVAVLPLLVMVTNSLRANRELATEPLGRALPPALPSCWRAWIASSSSPYSSGRG